MPAHAAPRLDLLRATMAMLFLPMQHRTVGQSTVDTLLVQLQAHARSDSWQNECPQPLGRVQLVPLCCVVVVVVIGLAQCESAHVDDFHLPASVLDLDFACRGARRDLQAVVSMQAAARVWIGRRGGELLALVDAYQQHRAGSEAGEPRTAPREPIPTKPHAAHDQVDAQSRHAKRTAQGALQHAHHGASQAKTSHLAPRNRRRAGCAIASLACPTPTMGDAESPDFACQLGQMAGGFVLTSVSKPGLAVGWRVALASMQVSGQHFSSIPI